MTRETADMSGKTVLVTGGTAGLGQAIAVGLARLGATVVVAGRDRGRGEHTVTEIQRASYGGRAEFVNADLLKLAGVRQLAADFRARHGELHVLVNNAGLLTSRRELTADGIESLFAIHVIAPFLLTIELLPMLRRGSMSAARVINTSAGSHRLGKLDLLNLNAERSFKPMTTYNTAKIASLLVGYELARRLSAKEVTLNAVDPGGVKTDLFRSAPVPWYVRPFMPVLGLLVAKTPEVAARTFLYVASSPDLEGVTGKYFSSMTERRSAKITYDETAARYLFDACAALAHVSTGELPSHRPFGQDRREFEERRWPQSPVARH